NQGREAGGAMLPQPLGVTPVQNCAPLRSMNRALYVVLGLAIGLLAGWFLFGRATQASEAAQTAAPSPSPMRSARAPIPDAPTLPPKPMAPSVVPTAPVGSASGPGVISPFEMQRLQARVAELEHKLALEKKANADKDGAPIPMPDHVDPRFSPEK